MSEAARTASADAASAHLGAPSEFILPRNADRDLKFSGWRIADAKSVASSAPYYATDVEIYTTIGGRIVTFVASYNLVYIPTDTAPKSTYTSGEWSCVISEAHRQKLEALDVKIVRFGSQTAVGVHDDADGALKWLKKENRGELGRLSKAAWITACAAWPALADMDCEVIE